MCNLIMTFGVCPLVLLRGEKISILDEVILSEAKGHIQLGVKAIVWFQAGHLPDSPKQTSFCICLEYKGFVLSICT